MQQYNKESLEVLLTSKSDVTAFLHEAYDALIESRRFTTLTDDDRQAYVFVYRRLLELFSEPEDEENTT